MGNFRISAYLLVLLTIPGTALAEDVRLAAPILEWSVYILLIFAVCVAIGISIFLRGKKDPIDHLGGLHLGTLFEEQDFKVYSVGPDTSITECVRRMNELKIGAMLVMEGEKLVGIFTERDAMNRVLGAGLDPTREKVAAVMTENPVCVPSTTTLEEAMGLVTERRIRHLPVVEGDKVIGVVSSGDLTRRLVEN